MDRRNLTHGGMLALAALIWGTAFVAQSVSMDYVGPCAFNAARSFVGCIALLPVIVVGNRLRGRKGLFEKNSALLRGGIACGVLLAAGNFAKLLLVDRLLLQNSEVTALVALVICLTLVCTVFCAKVVGCLLPLLAEKIGLDPAVMAAPFISTIVDVLSLLIYFQFATRLLGL